DNISGGNCRSITSQGEIVDRQLLKLSIDNISGGKCRSITSQGEIVDRQLLKLSIDKISGGKCQSTKTQGKNVNRQHLRGEMSLDNMSSENCQSKRMFSSENGH